MPHLNVVHLVVSKMLLVVQIQNLLLVVFDDSALDDGVMATVLPGNTLQAVEDAMYQLMRLSILFLYHQLADVACNLLVVAAYPDRASAHTLSLVQDQNSPEDFDVFRRSQYGNF